MSGLVKNSLYRWTVGTLLMLIVAMVALAVAVT
jgi:hypothetical protein